MTRIERNSPQEVTHDHPEAPVALAQKPKPKTEAATAGTSVLVSGYGSTKRALERDPSQADRLIGERLRGCSSTDREIVMRAVAQRGNTGLRKYADAEQVLSSLRPFDKDQRGDIVASMRVGTRCSDAMQDARASTKIPVQYEAKSGASAVAELQSKAIASSRAQAAKVTELSRHVMALSHEIGKVNRGAEMIAGGGSAVGLVGSAIVASGKSVVDRNSAELEKVAHRADTAGGLMLGELSGKIAAADATTQKFLKLTGNFTDARNQYERAVRSNDFPSMAHYSKQMGALETEMKRAATSLAGQAKSIVQLQKGLDHAIIETAITVVMTSVGLRHGGEAIHSFAEAAEHIAKDAVYEDLVSQGVGLARGH